MVCEDIKLRQKETFYIVKVLLILFNKIVVENQGVTVNVKNVIFLAMNGKKIMWENFKD